MLLVGGDFAGDIASGARGAGFEGSRIATFADNAGAVAWLRQHARAGDLVLLKASRKYRLEEIVEELKGTYAGS
jgi:UDP-N-acetylmuramyl pentapeptide synthase